MKQDKFDSIIYVRCPPKEKAMIEKKAKMTGQSTSAYMLEVTLREVTCGFTPICACGAHWGHRGKHWANTIIKN